MLRFRSSVGLIGAACIGMLSAGDVSAYVFYKTKDTDNPLRWFTGRPTYTWTMSTVEPEESTWDEAKAIIEAAYDVWVDTTCGVVPEFTFGGTTELTAATLPTSLASTPDNMVVFVRTRAQWTDSGNQTSWLAITKIANDSVSGEIVDADIEINDGMYTFHYGEDAPPAGAIDFRAMIVHEAGHFFGLDHSKSASATMYSTYSGDPVGARSIDQDDIDGVCTLYADAPAWVDRTIKPKPPSSDDGGCAGGVGGLGALLGGLGLAALGRRRRARC